MIVSFLLWVYAALLAFVWFFSGLTPEKAVLVRIGTGLLSDIVWIPFGLGLWGWVFYQIGGFAGKKKDRVVLYGAIAAGIAVFAVILFTEFAFRFQLIPLAVAGITLLFVMLYIHTWSLFLNRFLPIVIIGSFTFLNYGGQMIPKRPLIVKPEKSISIMTYNILGDAINENRMKAISVIRREDPDIVCCTEYNPQTDPALFTKELSRYYPYMISNRTSKSWLTGEIILSRYPVEFHPDDSTNTANHLSVVVDIDGEPVRLVVIHLTRVGRHDVDDSLVSLKDIALAMTKYECMNDQRKMRQAAYIFDRIEHETLPTIICGDFNDTPNGRVCRMFDTKYRDVFKLKGWGLGGTYGEKAIRDEFNGNRVISLFARDIIRIDHIYVSNDIDIISSDVVVNAEGSDHKPLKAILAIQ